MDTVRLDISLRVSRDTADTIRRLCDERGQTRASLVLEALGLMQAVRDGARNGMVAGLSRERENMSVILSSSLY